MSAAAHPVTTSRTSASIINWLHCRRIALTFGIVLAGLYLSLIAYKSYLEIDIQNFQGKGTYFKVYWASSEQGFTETRSSKARIRDGEYKLKMFLGNIGNIDRLRIDPLEYAGKALIKSISIKQQGYEPIQLGPQQLGALSPVNQIESTALTTRGLEINTDGKDGYLQLAVAPRSTGEYPWVHPVNALLIISLSLVMGNGAGRLLQKHLYVVAGLVVALVLAGIMSSITPYNVHPDERVHYQAVKYYTNHVLPPPLESEEIVESFSDYGKSRLSAYEAYYPLAGWFSRLLEPLNLADILSVRAFGFAMLFLLLTAAAAQLSFRYFALPLIISPQIWYLYSYANSDAFALTLCLFTAYQFAIPDSFLNRLLGEEKPRMLLPGLLGFGVLAGMLLLCKVNFYVFLLFLFLYIIWRQINGDFSHPRRIWTRLVVMGMIGLSMYGGRVALDYSVNGPDPRAKFNEFVERYAKEEYKLSTPAADQHIFLGLRGRGEPLDVVLGYLKWGGITASSALGSYGYAQYFGSDGYFAVAKILVTLLLGTMIGYALVYGPPRSHSLILIAMACTGLLLAASIWSSWNTNFQAQGRYLAPLIPVIGLVYYNLREYINHYVIGIFAVMLFLMSLYSFVFIGLGQIAKTSLSS